MKVVLPSVKTYWKFKCSVSTKLRTTKRFSESWTHILVSVSMQSIRHCHFSAAQRQPPMDWKSQMQSQTLGGINTRSFSVFTKFLPPVLQPELEVIVKLYSAGVKYIFQNCMPALEERVRYRVGPPGGINAWNHIGFSQVYFSEFIPTPVDQHDCSRVQLSWPPVSGFYIL